MKLKSQLAAAAAALTMSTAVPQDTNATVIQFDGLFDTSNWSEIASGSPGHLSVDFNPLASDISPDGNIFYGNAINSAVFTSGSTVLNFDSGWLAAVNNNANDQFEIDLLNPSGGSLPGFTGLQFLASGDLFGSTSLDDVLGSMIGQNGSLNVLGSGLSAYGSSFEASAAPSAVPEPGSTGLLFGMGVGALGLADYIRRRKSAAQAAPAAAGPAPTHE